MKIIALLLLTTVSHCIFAQRIADPSEINIIRDAENPPAAAPDGFHFVYWYKHFKDGGFKLKEVLLPNGKPIDQKPKDCAKKYLQDNWAEFLKYVLQNSDIDSKNFGETSVNTAIDNVTADTSISDALFDSLKPKSQPAAGWTATEGLTLNDVNPAPSYIRQSVVDADVNNMPSLASLMVHESMHAAFAAMSTNRPADFGPTQEHDLINSFLKSHPLHCAD